jgi:hypothetical protein
MEQLIFSVSFQICPLASEHHKSDIKAARKKVYSFQNDLISIPPLISANNTSVTDV